MVDLQNVMTHEAGHFLGLGHSKRAHRDDVRQRERGRNQQTRACGPTTGKVCARSTASLASISCEMKDYTPNHGFSADCAPSASSATTHNSLGCSHRGCRRKEAQLARPRFAMVRRRALSDRGAHGPRPSRARPSPNQEVALHTASPGAGAPQLQAVAEADPGRVRARGRVDRALHPDGAPPERKEVGLRDGGPWPIAVALVERGGNVRSAVDVEAPPAPRAAARPAIARAQVPVRAPAVAERHEGACD